MTTELIMEDDNDMGFFNMAAMRARMSRASNQPSNSMPQPGSRLAAMAALSARGGRRGSMMSMAKGLRFAQSQRGVPISRSRKYGPGYMTKTDRARAYGKRKKLARVAKKVITKSRGRTPAHRARRAVFMLVHLFTGKGAKALDTNARQSIKAIADTAAKRAGKNKFPALTIKEIEGLYNIST